MAGEQRRSAAEVLGLPEPIRMPSSVDVEQAVLGALMLDNGLYARVSDLLKPESFFEQIHSEIYRVIESYVPAGKIANAITIKTQLGDQDLGGVTVGEYLARLRAEAGLPAEIRGYAEILHHLAVRREVISIAEEARDRAYHSPVEDTAKSLVDAMLDRLSSLNTAPREGSGFEDFGEASMRALLAAQESYQRGGELAGLSTGYPRLDDVIGGLQKTDLIILAGRPGMGKTALATNVAFRIATHLDAKRANGEKTGVVAFFSLEMSSEQLSGRIIAEQSGVPEWKVRRGKLSAEDMEAMIEVQRALNRIPLKIDPTSGLTIGALKTRARALKKRLGLELIVVDYLQLLASGRGRFDNRNLEVAEITSGLKALAKDLDVPVLALSQLSREVEKRDDRRPQLSDLRDSGSIEQDADQVLFVVRDEYYLRKEKAPPEGTDARYAFDRKMARAKGVCEVLVAKNRHGPEGSVDMGFDGEVSRFMDEPEPRPEWADAPREAAPKVKHPSTKSIQALRILKGLSQSHPSLGVDLVNVPASAKRPVSYVLWRERCAAELLDPSRGEKDAAKLMEAVVLELKEHDMIGRGGTKDHPYAWLTPKGDAHG